MTQPVGILVLAYGGPGRLDEVEEFLGRVMAPRTPPAEVVERAKRKYQAIGGGSPLVANTHGQADALERRLRVVADAEAAVVPSGLAVAVGFKNWRPSISEAVARLVDAGCHEIHAVILASHQSTGSTGGYVESVRSALESHPETVAHFAPPFEDDDGYLTAVAERTREALETVHGPVRVVYTAHSLPLLGPDTHEGYRAGLLETAGRVSRLVGIADWSFAFQSASRRPGVEWMGPDVAEEIEGFADSYRSVTVVPLGFVSEHLETLWDLDNALAGKAKDLGLEFSRAAALGEHPAFIGALADSVVESIRAARSGSASPAERTHR